jgi:hypothetical protein
VLAEINTASDKAYTTADVKIDFAREIIINETDTANIKKTEADTVTARVNTVLNVSALLPPEVVAEQVCNELGIDYEKIKDKLPAFVQETPKNFDVLGGGVISSSDVQAAAGEVIGKTLNGAQTQSLISVVLQYQQGVLTKQQAVNIISISIGISKDEAIELIEETV